MNTKYSFTKEEVEYAAANASSRTEMMRLLKIKNGGGGYQALDFWCKKYDVTPPTYKPGSNLKEHSFVAMSDSEWFVKGVRRNSAVSKKRMIALGIPNICLECGQEPIWNSKPLVLQLDHIDGDRWNNTLENLRILCPHCHTQTETYANNGLRRARNYCECGAEIWRGSERCIKCSNAIHNKEKIDWPPVEELIEQVRLTNFSQAAKMYNCTDSAIRKFLTRNGIDWRNIK